MTYKTHDCEAVSHFKEMTEQGYKYYFELDGVEYKVLDMRDPGGPGYEYLGEDNLWHPLSSGTRLQVEPMILNDNWLHPSMKAILTNKIGEA